MTLNQNPPYENFLRTPLTENISPLTSGETDGGAGGRPPPLAGHFEVFGPPVTTLLILLSNL